jgi:hypothetical protein
MLVAALGPWPYDYYMLLRMIVCVAAALLALLAYRRSDELTIWFGVFVTLAILFNPILPIHLTRSVWTILDLGGAALFAAHFFVSRTESADAQ